MRTRSFKDLLVWQKVVRLTVQVYEMTGRFPEEERYGLSAQMRRAAISISSNIAEEYQRGSRREYVRFLQIAAGSCAELESQCVVAAALGWFGTQTDGAAVESVVQEVARMLHAMVRQLERSIS